MLAGREEFGALNAVTSGASRLSPPSVPPPQRIARATAEATALLDEEYATHWTLCHLARCVCSNRCDLERGFKLIWSCTVHRHLMLCRIRAARRLLATTAWSVDEIGKSVGYRSKSAFFSAFRQLVGMTPDQYRGRWVFTLATPSVLELLNPN